MFYELAVRRARSGIHEEVNILLQELEEVNDSAKRFTRNLQHSIMSGMVKSAKEKLWNAMQQPRHVVENDLTGLQDTYSKQAKEAFEHSEMALGQVIQLKTQSVAQEPFGES